MKDEGPWELFLRTGLPEAYLFFKYTETKEEAP